MKYDFKAYGLYLVQLGIEGGVGFMGGLPSDKTPQVGGFVFHPIPQSREQVIEDTKRAREGEHNVQ